MKKKIIASLLITTIILGNASTVALAADSLKAENTTEQQSSPRAVFFESDVKYSIEMIEHYYWIFDNHSIFAEPDNSFHRITQRLKADFLVPSKENFEKYLITGDREMLEDGIGYFLDFCSYFRAPASSYALIIITGIGMYRNFYNDREYMGNFWNMIH